MKLLTAEELGAVAAKAAVSDLIGEENVIGKILRAYEALTAERDELKTAPISERLARIGCTVCTGVHFQLEDDGVQFIMMGRADASDNQEGANDD